MMRYLELLASVFESFIITESTTRCLGYKNNKHIIAKFIIYFVLTVSNSLFLPYLINSNLLPGVTQIIISFVFAVIFLQGTIFSKFFISVVGNISILVINIVTMSIFSYFTQLDFNELIINQTSNRILLLFITKFAYFLFTRLTLKLFKKEKYPLTAQNWYVIISLLLLSLMSGLIVFEMNLHTTFNAVFIAVTTVLIIVVNTAAYVILTLSVRFNIANSKVEMLEKYKILSENEIKKIDENNYKTRQIRHELKNNSLLIQSLINQGNLEEAKNMLIGITNINLGEDKQYIKLKYNMIETIINNKLTICEKENIIIKVCDISGIKDDLGEISESDMCTILGNLLDNSIESCRKCKCNTTMEIITAKEKEHIIITVKNTTATQKLSYNEKALKTSKSDKENHGLGTQIINELVSKYDGSTKYEISGNQFVACISLKCFCKL